MTNLVIVRREVYMCGAFEEEDICEEYWCLRNMSEMLSQVDILNSRSSIENNSPDYRLEVRK